MKLSEINTAISQLESIGDIELLAHYYTRKKRILTLLAYNIKKELENTILTKGIGALNTEELEVAQYLVNHKEMAI